MPPRSTLHASLIVGVRFFPDAIVAPALRCARISARHASASRRRLNVLELVSKVGVESAVADDAAGESEQALVDVAAAFVAGRESAEGVQPGEGALDDPAPATESGAMLGLAARDTVTDAARPEQAAVLVVVIATVGDDHRGPVTGPPDATADGRDAVEQRHQLGHVVTVAGGRAPGEREPARVDD